MTSLSGRVNRAISANPEEISAFLSRVQEKTILNSQQLLSDFGANKLSDHAFKQAIHCAEEAFVLPPCAFLAVRSPPGIWEYIRIDVKSFVVEDLTAAAYLKFKKPLVDGVDNGYTVVDVDFLQTRQYNDWTSRVLETEENRGNYPLSKMEMLKDYFKECSKYLFPLLISILGLVYTAKNENPAHFPSTWIFIVSLLCYWLLHLLSNLNNNYDTFLFPLAALFAILSTLSLLFLFLPNPLYHSFYHLRSPFPCSSHLIGISFVELGLGFQPHCSVAHQLRSEMFGIQTMRSDLLSYRNFEGHFEIFSFFYCLYLMSCIRFVFPLFVYILYVFVY